MTRRATHRSTPKYRDRRRQARRAAQRRGPLPRPRTYGRRPRCAAICGLILRLRRHTTLLMAAPHASCPTRKRAPNPPDAGPHHDADLHRPHARRDALTAATTMTATRGSARRPTPKHRHRQRQARRVAQTRGLTPPAALRRRRPTRSHLLHHSPSCMRCELRGTLAHSLDGGQQPREGSTAAPHACGAPRGCDAGARPAEVTARHRGSAGAFLRPRRGYAQTAAPRDTARHHRDAHRGPAVDLASGRRRDDQVGHTAAPPGTWAPTRSAPRARLSAPSARPRTQPPRHSAPGWTATLPPDAAPRVAPDRRWRRSRPPASYAGRTDDAVCLADAPRRIVEHVVVARSWRRPWTPR